MTDNERQFVEHAAKCMTACEGINPEAVPKMLAALERVEMLYNRPEESDMDRRYRVEDVFRRETRLYPPGRDIAPSAGYCEEHDMNFRIKAWKDWHDAIVAQVRDALELARTK